MRELFARLVGQLSGWKLVVILLACVIAFVVVSLSSCASQHVVKQSSTSESFIRGDTTVTSVTIRYEQLGSTSKTH